MGLWKCGLVFLKNCHPCCCCCQVASVVSDSVRPLRRQPTRLPRPWESPDKNTGVGCDFLLQCMKVKSESEVAQSCPTLRDPMDCSPPGSSVHGIFQARVLERGASAFCDEWALGPTGCSWCSARDLKTGIIHETCNKTGYQLWSKNRFFTHTHINKPNPPNNKYLLGFLLKGINLLKIATFTRMNFLTIHEFNISNCFANVLQCFT